MANKDWIESPPMNQFTFTKHEDGYSIQIYRGTAADEIVLGKDLRTGIMDCQRIIFDMILESEQKKD
jgi:hypothetical protein